MNFLNLWSCGFGLLVSQFFLRMTLVQPFDFKYFFLIFLVGVGFYLVSIFLLFRRPCPPSWGWIFFVSFFSRILLWTNHPILSNDVFRYLWDGLILQQGWNPLQYSPADPLFHSFFSFFPFLLDHQDVPSIYPPLSQGIFWFGSILLFKPVIFCLLMTFFDCGSIFLLRKILQNHKKQTNFSLIFGWHPLSILESGHSGHIDSAGVFFLCLGLFFLHRKKFLHLMSVLAAGLIKLWPFCFLLGSVFQFQRKKIWVGVWMIGIFLFFFGMGWNSGQLNGLILYGKNWEFNGSLFPLFRWLFGAFYARWMVLGGFLVWIVFLWIRKISSPDFSIEEMFFFMVCGFLLFSPVVYPWYSLWLIPFLTLSFQIEWIYLTLILPFSYLILPAYLEKQIWEETLESKLVIYFPLYLFFLGRFLLHRKKENLKFFQPFHP